MDLFEELETMAVNAANEIGTEAEPSEEELTRWQKLFGYSHLEAVEHLQNQRSDLTRFRASDDHWDLVRSQKEAEGFDRESYEHSIERGTQSTASRGQEKMCDISANPVEASYLVLLEGVLDSPERIQDIARMPEAPPAPQGISEKGDALFVRVSGDVKLCITAWLSLQKSSHKPTFVRLSKAKKDLAVDSIYPTLGKDSTLPQHRRQSSSFIGPDTTLSQHYDSVPHLSAGPIRQDEYPVWYFFYGTLADSDFLSRLLSLPEAENPELIPASVSGGIITTWNGKYKALVDGTDGDHHVHGSAYKVTTKEREEALMIYEMDKYEVVRCCIKMPNQTAQGLTFRFAASL